MTGYPAGSDVQLAASAVAMSAAVYDRSARRLAAAGETLLGTEAEQGFPPPGDVDYHQLCADCNAAYHAMLDAQREHAMAVNDEEVGRARP